MYVMYFLIRNVNALVAVKNWHCVLSHDVEYCTRQPDASFVQV